MPHIIHQHPTGRKARLSRNYVQSQKKQHPCRTGLHNVSIGPDDSAERIEPILAEFFVAGRGERTNSPSDPNTLDLMNIGTSGGDGGGMDKWRPLIEAAMAQRGLMLMTFHGVGPNLQQLYVQESEQRALLGWLGELVDRVWVAPVIEVARWIVSHRH
jgi:hypothetical protein